MSVADKPAAEKYPMNLLLLNSVERPGFSSEVPFFMKGPFA
jgi:hypothetical protein